MSPSAQLTSEQLKEFIEDEKKTDEGSREVQEQVEDGEEVLDPDNTSSVLSTVLNTINNEFEHECLDEAVRLLKAHPICQSTDDRVPGHKYSIADLPETKFLAHQVWAIWFIVRRWVWEMLICQEHWWRMKWVLERLSPRLQLQCFANW
jgi:hypothetical protein